MWLPMLLNNQSVSIVPDLYKSQGNSSESFVWSNEVYTNISARILRPQIDSMLIKD